MCIAWAKFGKPDLALTLNGALAGLVAVTASCAVVSPGNAIYIGAIGGVLCIYGVRWLDRLQIDDPVGAVPVHGLNGVWGTLAVGLFGRAAFGAPSDGLFYGGGFGQLGIQALGVGSVVLFVVLSMWLVFKTIDALVGLCGCLRLKNCADWTSASTVSSRTADFRYLLLSSEHPNPNG